MRLKIFNEKARTRALSNSRISIIPHSTTIHGANTTCGRTLQMQETNHMPRFLYSNQEPREATWSIDHLMKCVSYIVNVRDEAKIDTTWSEAVEIVEGIPISQRDQIIGKYIILGELVVSHASINTLKETVEEFLVPLRSNIEAIREQMRLIAPTIATRSIDHQQQTL